MGFLSGSAVQESLDALRIDSSANVDHTDSRPAVNRDGVRIDPMRDSILLEEEVDLVQTLYRNPDG
jgi:hypothetical protein